MLRIKTLLFLLFISAKLYSQTYTDCKALIMGYLKKTNVTEMPPDGMAYLMRFSTQKIFRDSVNNPTKKVNMNIRMSATSYVLESDVMDYYFDEKNVFIAIHPEKKIVWTNKSDSKTDVNAWKKVFNDRDSMFAASKVVSCTDYIDKKTNHAMKKIVLKTTDKWQTKLQVNDLIVLYDLKDQKMVSTTVNYGKKSNVVQLISGYDQIVFDKKDDLPKDYSKVLLQKGMPKGKYTGYTLEDKRKKQNN